MTTNKRMSNYTNVQISFAGNKNHRAQNILDQLMHKMVQTINSFRGTECPSWLFARQSHAVRRQTSFVSGFDRPDD